jgi:hypothetical protein
MGSVDPDRDPDSQYGSGHRRAKITHKNRKNVYKFNFLKFSMFFFEGPEGFSCSLNDL